MLPDLLRGVDLFQVQSFEALETLEEVVARFVPAFRAAHADGAPVLSCLVSAAQEADPGLRWLLGFAPITAPCPPAPTQADLRLPAGVLAQPVTSAFVEKVLGGCDEWVTLAGSPVPRKESINSQELRGALLAQLVHRSFVCLIRAEPVMVTDLADELTALDRVARTGQIQGRGEFASSRTSLELASERYAELAVARQLGGWRVRVEVAAPKSDASRVALLLAAALEVPGLALGLHDKVPSPQSAGNEWREPRQPFVASTRQLAMMLRAPSRELPGVALRQRMPFDMNAETDGNAGPANRPLDLGMSLDSRLQPAGRFTVDTTSLNRHALVCGATGSGKTQTVQQMLEQLTAVGVPWLVVEPAKSEYRALPSRLAAAGLGAAVHVIRLGDPAAPPIGLNPLEPEVGFPLQTHLDMVSALFVASFDAAEPFPQILTEALRRCYTDLGWVLATGEYKTSDLGRPCDRGQKHLRYPTLTDLQRTARDVVHGVGYGQEVRDNVLGFVDVRLGSLRNGTPGRFFQGGHPLDLAALLVSNVVIEIEDVGNDLDKAFVIGTLILRLYEHLRVRGPSQARGLTHVTVVEEAHRLLRRAEPGGKQNQAVELFGSLLSEVRAYGEGIIIAEQIPTKILPDVLKNTAVQIVHRLPSVEDRAVLAGTTNMSEAQSAFVLSLRPGFAAAFREGMDAPVLLKVNRPDRPTEVDAEPLVIGALRQRPLGAACDTRCQAAPCSAAQLDAGKQLARRFPELPFWLELVFLAYVSDTAVPLPGRVWSASLRARLQAAPLPPCAIGNLVEASVTARWAEVADFYDPTLLTVAMTASVRRMLLDGGDPGDTARFAAGRFLLRHVHNDLVAAEDSPEPHPRTHEWRGRLGVELPDAGTLAQRFWLEHGPIFCYIGHDGLVRGQAPGGGPGPVSRLERLATPLSGGVNGLEGVAAACLRATRTSEDAQAVLQRFGAALGLKGD